jgi:Flp pilus assembly protein TadB
MQPGSMQTLWRIRWLILGLSFLLGIAVIASGAVVIGGIILLLCVTRLVMFRTMQRRRREFEQRFRPPGANWRDNSRDN